MTLKNYKKLTILVLTLFLAIGLVNFGIGSVNAQADKNAQPQPSKSWSDTGLTTNNNDNDDIKDVSKIAGPINRANVDYNGDGRSDYVITRNSNSLLVWWTAISGSSNFSSFQWGLATDVPIPADFDGDGTTDFAVWRDQASDPNRATFYILRSLTNTVQIEQFGRTADNPRVVGDYDGDGKADVAVYREGVGSGGQSFYFYRPSGTPGVNFIPRQFGTTGDKAVPGDYDGDGRYDVGVTRNVGGRNIFIYLRSSDTGDRYVDWGLPSDVIVPGDYDGDGRSDFCVVRTMNGQLIWYILEADGGTQAVNWGLAADVPTPGDYDGDRRQDVAVWRGGAGENNFYVRRSSNSQLQAFNWGIASDYPAASWLVVR